MVIFHSYVGLPEDSWDENQFSDGKPILFEATMKIQSEQKKGIIEPNMNASSLTKIKWPTKIG